MTQQFTLSEHTRLLAWLCSYYSGTPMHDIIEAREINYSTDEPRVCIVWKDARVGTHYNMMRPYAT